MTNPAKNPEEYNKLVDQYKTADDEARANLQKKIIDQPELVLGNLHAMISKEQQEKQKPLAQMFAQTYLKEDDDFKTIYQLPSIKQRVDSYVKERIELTGGITPDELDQVKTHFKEMAEAFKTKEVSSMAKNKVGMTTGKGSDGKLEFTEMDLEEASRVYKERSKTPQGRKINLEFEGTPEGKKFLRAMLEQDPRKKRS